MQYLVQEKLHKTLHGIRYLAMAKVIAREVAEVFFEQAVTMILVATRHDTQKVVMPKNAWQVA